MKNVLIIHRHPSFFSSKTNWLRSGFSGRTPRFPVIKVNMRHNWTCYSYLWLEWYNWRYRRFWLEILIHQWDFLYPQALILSKFPFFSFEDVSFFHFLFDRVSFGPQCTWSSFNWINVYRPIDSFLFLSSNCHYLSHLHRFFWFGFIPRVVIVIDWSLFWWPYLTFTGVSLWQSWS